VYSDDQIFFFFSIQFHFIKKLLLCRNHHKEVKMSADIQQNILVQLQGDAPVPVDGDNVTVPDLTPIGVVDPPETKKRAKKASGDETPDEPKKKAAPRRKKAANASASDEGSPIDEEEEEEEEEEKPKRKRKRPTEAASAPQDDANGETPAPKPKKTKKSPSDTSKKSAAKGAQAQPKKKPSAPRKQPGYAMIKTEDDRLRSALEALLHKREQREATSGGKAPTSTCGVLTNNLVDFYENVVDSFARKFGRYIN
jgi:hypothetical protein